MKEFFKMFFASLLAMAVVAFGGMLFMGIFIGVVVATSGHKAPTLRSDSMLVFDMSVNITDAPQSDQSLSAIYHSLGHGGPTSISLRRVLDTLHSAEKDPRIKGLFLHGSFDASGYGTGFGTLKEVRQAVEEFKKSGKPVIAYLVAPTTRDFYVASVANKIYLNPFGEVMTPGLASQPYFLGGFFQRYGVGVQVAKVGKYKSYAEQYVREHMSDPAKEETQKVLDDIWKNYIDSVASSRSMAPSKLQALIDSEGMITAQSAKKAGLVDELAYLPKVIGDMKSMTGVKDKTRTFRQIDFNSYSMDNKTLPEEVGDNTIAIVYAQGVIVDGEGNPDQVGGDRISRLLRRLRNDDRVKAIVLRVNSPGGSALAAESIEHEVLLTERVKPVVVSMGSYAASGGYWITTNSDHIFAEPTTITGSIGVISIIPNIQKLANDHGINFDTIKTGKFADLYSIAEPKTDAEMALMQSRVNEIYGQFLRRVSEGRKLSIDAVKLIAQGRVWSGEDAQKIGLVDQLGGLQDAIKYAAKKAKLGDNYEVSDYPHPVSFMDRFVQNLQGDFNPVGGSGPVSKAMQQIKTQVDVLGSLNDPQGMYAIDPDLVIAN